jgi:hypothetical protein
LFSRASDLAGLVVGGDAGVVLLHGDDLVALAGRGSSASPDLSRNSRTGKVKL